MFMVFLAISMLLCSSFHNLFAIRYEAYRLIFMHVFIPSLSHTYMHLCNSFGLVCSSIPQNRTRLLAARPSIVHGGLMLSVSFSILSDYSFVLVILLC